MEILLGQGAFKIDGVIVGLTRGGGSFGIEQEIKDIEADGDYGPVKGRQKIIKRIPKIKLKRLQKVLADFTKMYPNMKTTTTTSYSGVTWSGTGNILNGDVGIALADTDYHTVEFVGKTLEGKPVVLKIFNGMARDKIEWALTDKEEVIAEIEYTGHYTEGSTVQPWEIFYPTATLA